MKIKSFLATSLLFLLAACGPPQPYFQTTYQMVPPPSENGRMCANNCLMMQQNCRGSCSIQSQQCSINNTLAQQNAHHEAEEEYEDYVRDRQAIGKLIKKKREDFYSAPSNDCSTEACTSQCANDYNMCYTNCGGQIIPHTNCVANCNMIGAPQVPQP